VKRAKLSEVAKINPRLPKGLDEAQPVSFLSMASVSETGKVLFQETRKLAETKKGYTYFERGDILLAKITPCFENGKAAHVSDLEHPIGFGSTEFHVLRPDPECLDAKYLFFLVWNKRLRYLGQKAMKGAAGHKRVPSEFLEKYDIPLPSLDDQKRIAHLLSKVEGLIAQRKQHLQLLDDLLKSVFLEMFGDPVRNEKGWDKPGLSKFGEISTGNTPPRKDPSNYASKHIEWIKTDNIIADSLYVTKAAEYLSENGLMRGRTVTKGALLIACIAGSIESIGRAALSDRTVAFNQQINAIQPFKDVNPFYLYALFLISRTYIQGYAAKGMKKILTKGEFENIPMIKPPIGLQDQFGEIVVKLEDIKVTYRESLSDLHNLYAALSQKAFKGELDLSRVLLQPPTEDLGFKGYAPSAIVETIKEQWKAVNLPDVENMMEELATIEGRQRILQRWLEANLAQPKDAAFLVNAFMVAAQARISELTPENDLEIGISEYEHLKEWLFRALGSGHLSQVYDDAGNSVQLSSVKA